MDKVCGVTARGSMGRAGRHIGLIGAILLFHVSGMAAADFRLSDPSSEIYYSLAAASGGDISVEHDAQVTGNLHANDRIAVKESGQVNGDVSAVGDIDNKGTISGSVMPGASSRALPRLFSEAEARALADRVFESATVFSNTTIDDVVFVKGNVRLAGAVNGVGTIIATGHIEVEKVDAGAGPGLLQSATRLSLIAFQHVKVHDNRSLRGSLYAGSHVMIEKDVSFEGVLVAGHTIQIRQGAVVTFLNPDDVPPSVAIVSPAEGKLLPDATPSLRATISDGVAGIDPAGVRLTIDGVDRTGEVRVISSTATFAPATPLPDGLHAAVLSVRDYAGNEASDSRSFMTDTIPPTVLFSSPSGPVSPGDQTPDIVVSFTDATSGVKPGTVRVSVDGVELTHTSCTVSADLAQCKSPVLGAGLHLIGATAIDRAGNPRDVSKTLEILPDLEVPVVRISSPANGSLVGALEVVVAGSAVDASGVRSVRANGAEGTVDGDSFQVSVPLAEGVNHLLITATDSAGNDGFASLTLVADITSPTLEIRLPQNGDIVNHAALQMAGSARDDSGLEALTVDGALVPVVDGSFETTVAAAPGENRVRVRVTDRAGNLREETISFNRFVLPEVAITSPQDLATVAATTVDVTGTVSDPGAAVAVNGVAAVVAGSSFTAADVPLIEGGNIVTAVARAADGHTGTDTINVVRDLTPPHVAVEYPRDGARLFEPEATVTGLANDIVAGTVNSSEVAVTVNGRPAQVSNRSFAAAGVPLLPGANTLTVLAVDEAGNTSQTSITVQLAAATVPRISVISGRGQQGAIGTLLAEPLIVVLHDSAGLPVAGRQVVFEVRGSNGSLDGGQRQLAVPTDASGQAQVRFTLGTRAGVANQVVEASAVGFAGPAVFTVTALAGPAAAIVVDAGDQQVGVAGQALPRPLVAAVTDAGHNRLEGIPIRWTAVRGKGRFANGLQEITVESDSDGRVIVPFILDTEEGVANNVVEAAIEDLPDSPVASFVASGRVAGDPASTSVSGTVLDNENRPIQGVTARILDTTLTAVTDASGLFRIAPAPVGTVRLLVDGSTANRPEPFPDLEFVLATVPGRDNTVNMPIFLVPLDLGNSVVVDETRGGTIALPEIPGFALEIAPGSVTFPGGSKSGVVSVTVVHSDKVPMVPNFGQQPRLIVTIQPAGARFDPPARLILPNVEGLAAGEVTEFYSFDHDLGHFVSIGPATVSEDGLVIVSNPGVGIVKAGWHCGGSPSSSGTAHNCPRCHTCRNNTCVADDTQSCNDNDDCTVNDRCRGGSCTGDRRKIDSVDARGNGSIAPEVFIERDVSFTVNVQGQHCSGSDLTYRWNFGDGQTSTSQSPTHKYDKPGTYNVQVEVKCRNCATKTASLAVTVKCPQVRITGTDPASGNLCPGCTMQFFAEVDPPDFTVKFRLADGGDLGGKASITEGGLLTVASDASEGNVVVKATVTDDGEDCFDQRSVFVFVPSIFPRGIFTGRTLGEKLWAIRHPVCAWQIRNIQGECFREMGRHFTAAQQQDPNVGNAFLHAFCNCLTARQCGVDAAKELWDAHEEYNGNTCQYASMDFNNNEVGRQVSSQSGDCSTLVLGALGAGQLRWMDPPPAPGDCPQFRQ